MRTWSVFSAGRRRSLISMAAAMCMTCTAQHGQNLSQEAEEVLHYEKGSMTALLAGAENQPGNGSAHSGEAVVGALALVDMVVGVHHRLVPEAAAQDFYRAIGNHLGACENLSRPSPKALCYPTGGEVK